MRLLRARHRGQWGARTDQFAQRASRNEAFICGCSATRGAVAGAKDATTIIVTGDRDSRMERATVICSVKDEAPFLMEWIAYHKAIGFDDIIVASNDCEDKSDVLLDALCWEGIISHRHNIVPPGHDAQYTALKDMPNNPLVLMSDWIACLDVDEYLNIEFGDGTVNCLLDQQNDVDAIVILWRYFGSSNTERWTHGSVLERFVLSESEIQPHNRYHKTLFRNNGKFLEMDAHYPRTHPKADISLTNIVNTENRLYDLSFLEDGSRRLAPLHDVSDMWTWKGACVNHYSVLTPDILAMKRYRGDNVPGRGDQKYAPNSWYVRVGDKNDVEERSILRMIPGVRRWLAAMRSSPRIRDAETAALAAYDELRARVLAGNLPAGRP